MSSMKRGNRTTVSEFLLLGLPIPPEHQGLFFTLFLVMYLATVLGNLLIILLIRMDSRLHTPMYFFLSHLALTDICYSSVTVPKMLMDMKSIHKSIPYAGCVSQMYFYIWFASVDIFLLTLMAYDRYVAICHPLHYATIMRQEKCVSLVSASWIYCSLRSLLHILLFIRVSFCDDITIPHFFCEIPVLLKISCSDVSVNEWLIFIETGIIVFLPFATIVGSYIWIWASVLKDPSVKRFFKVLSTCGSHLLVVCLFYGTIAEVYFFSSPSISSNKDIAASVMYMIVTPMLNPFIYSLRNRDIKQALKLFVNRMKILSSMKRGNRTTVSEFLLLGLPIPPEHQGLFFTLFLVMYLATVLGNLLIILLIRMDSRLHTPMYFFLSNLALTDICFSSVTVPKMLMDMQSIHKSIPYAGCVSQMYFYIWFACVDIFLLTLMAYDRYVAICHPLHYTTIMRQEKCVSLVSASWIYCSLRSLLHTLLFVRVSFCEDITIPHFFCELPVLLKMSCSDVSVNEWVIFFETGIIVFLPFASIVGSYIWIWASVLKDPSVKRFFKVLSTCGSHLLVVCLFYGTIVEVYFFSSPSISSNKDIAASVMYMIVTPMLNPFIYSLRNRDIKQALILFVNRMKSCSSNNLI
ncbi:olfactory receptor 2M2-like [Sorex araneus]|uniref:olfactory receptor 2M2-like n=1 Tax=Sorex araneus TaxID=42254 RepID=UPI002433931C|nr:olfactory receptor 2M2-like [Sorex araneus]